MPLKFRISLEKGLRLKVRKFWRLIPTLVEVTGEKLIGGLLHTPQHRLPNLKRVKIAKDVRLNSNNYFIKKIPNKRELQQIDIDYLSHIDFKGL